MIFGDSNTFAIEAGAIEHHPMANGPYIQFRFWIGNQPIGDWEDRIPFKASIENAIVLCDNKHYREEWLFDSVPSKVVFQKVYDAFFGYDYTKSPALSPNLRDRYHLDDIAMGAVQDQYGLILVQNTHSLSRVIVKDLIKSNILIDITFESGHVEHVLKSYVEWGLLQLG